MTVSPAAADTTQPAASSSHRAGDGGEHLGTVNRRETNGGIPGERDPLQGEIGRRHQERPIRRSIAEGNPWDRFRPRKRIDEGESFAVVERARHPGGVDPSPIVEAEGDVGGLLDLVDEDPGAERVGGPGRDQHRHPDLGGNPAQTTGRRPIGSQTGGREFLQRHPGIQPEVDDAPRLGRQDVVGLRLAGAEPGRGGGAVVRMDLDRQIRLPVDQLDEQRKDRSPAGCLEPAGADPGRGIAAGQLAERVSPASPRRRRWLPGR